MLLIRGVRSPARRLANQGLDTPKVRSPLCMQELLATLNKKDGGFVPPKLDHRQWFLRRLLGAPLPPWPLCPRCGLGGVGGGGGGGGVLGLDYTRKVEK